MNLFKEHWKDIASGKEIAVDKTTKIASDLQRGDVLAKGEILALDYSGSVVKAIGKTFKVSLAPTQVVEVLFVNKSSPLTATDKNAIQKEIFKSAMAGNLKKDDSPFAICTASVGRENSEKYEACVLDVKAKLGIAKSAVAKDGSWVKCQCGVVMSPNNEGCRFKKLEINGKTYNKVPNGGGVCHDCNAGSGRIHHVECDMERCPIDGTQLISDDEHGDAIDKAINKETAEEAEEISEASFQATGSDDVGKTQKSGSDDVRTAERLQDLDDKVRNNIKRQSGDVSEDPKYIAGVKSGNRSGINANVMAILEDENYHSLVHVLMQLGAPRPANNVDRGGEKAPWEKSQVAKGETYPMKVKIKYLLNGDDSTEYEYTTTVDASSATQAHQLALMDLKQHRPNVKSIVYTIAERADKSRAEKSRNFDYKVTYTTYDLNGQMKTNTQVINAADEQQARHYVDIAIGESGNGSGKVISVELQSSKAITTSLGAQRYNNKMDRAFADAKRIEQERLRAGEEPNPNLTSPEEAKKYGWVPVKIGGYSRYQKVKTQKDFDLAGAGPVPHSLLARQDLEGKKKKDDGMHLNAGDDHQTTESISDPRDEK